MQDGGYLAGIVQHQSGRLLARPDGGGIYRSDNQGNSWTWLGSNMVTQAALVAQGIAVPQSANSSSNLILMACGYGDATATDPGRGIWKSTDGGASWTETRSGVNFSGGDAERVGGECIIFNPSNDNEVWAGSRGNGLWVSQDAGNTWTENSSLQTNICCSLYMHPMATNTIFYGGDGGLWVSTNHGANWAQLISNPLVYRIASGPDGTVYFGGGSGSPQLLQKITSTNWGIPASYVFTSLVTAYQSGIGSDGLSLITVTVLKDGRLLVSDGEGYLRVSSNQGTNFSTLNTSQYAPGLPIPQWASPTVFQWKPTSLIQDVHNTNFWYGGAGYGPMATTNSGTNWQYIVNGLGEVDVWRVSFHPTDPNRIYISCDDLGGAIVTDGGLSGNTATMLYDAFNYESCCQVARRALVCYTNGYNRVIFTGGSEQLNECRLFESINDGVTWFYPPMTGLPTTVSGTPIVAAIDSLDNPDDFLVVATGTVGPGKGGVYRTTNGGTNFTQSSWSTNISGLNLGTYNYCTVYMDRDATNVNIRYLLSGATYPSTPPANDGAGFYISYDRGVTWTQTAWPLIAGDYNDFQGKMVSDHAVSGHVWIAFTTYPGNSVWNGLGYSVNYGTNFVEVGGFTNAVTVAAYSNQVAVFGQMTGDVYPKIYYSSNNGSTWGVVSGTNAQFPETATLDIDPHWPGRIFISNTGRSVSIFVPTASRQTPIMTNWPTATAITYGQTLANSFLTGGSASLGGSFTFTAPSTVPGPGAASQSVTFTPTNTTFYSNVVGTVSVTVNPLPVILKGAEAYNGSTTVAATVLSVSNAIGSDNVTVASGSATLAGSAVGVQSITDPSTLVLGGAQVANYTVTGASGAVTITNPFNPISITSAALDVSGTNLVFSWQSVPGVVYTVLTNNALTSIQNWSVAGILVTATNTTTSITMPGVVFAGSNLFVAIKQQ